MRTIKFRGKVSKDYNSNFYNEQFVYGSAIVCEDDIASTIINSEFEAEVLTKTITQFSGVKDKNGKEIYEGDIIKIESKLMKEYPDYKFIREVKFGKGEIFGSEWNHDIIGFWLSPCETYKELYLDDEDADIEIIGNVFETPELINLGGEEK